MTAKEVVIFTPRRPTLEEFYEYSERLNARLAELSEAQTLLATWLHEHLSDPDRPVMDLIAEASLEERQVVLDAIDRLGGCTFPEVEETP
jgi:hypothetical protein